jgi:hypothetical protein
MRSTSSFLPARLPSKLSRALEVAIGEDGQVEVPKGSNRGARIDIYRPDWRREDFEKADRKAGRQVPGDAWCCWFGTWVWYEAWGEHPLGRQIGGCYALVQRAQKLGLWMELPKPQLRTGQLIGPYPGAAFVRLDEPMSAGPSAGHFGLMTGVEELGWDVSTVEGNSGDGVRLGVRDLRDPKIRGLVLPLGLEHCTGDWERRLLSGADLARLGTR